VQGFSMQNTPYKRGQKVLRCIGGYFTYRANRAEIGRLEG
jgi:hypothetical protein